MQFEVGDKIDITVDGNIFYKSVIGHIADTGRVLVNTPIYKREPVQYNVYDKVYFVYYRESGRYFVQAQVAGFQTINGVRFIVLEPMIEPIKEQRRESYRLATRIDAELYEYTEDAELYLEINDEVTAELITEVKVRDLSITGAALISKFQCELKEKYLLKLVLDDRGNRSKAAPFWICGTVVRSELTNDNKTYDIGIRFFGMTSNKNDFLSKYIMTQQQKRLAQKRLVEG